MCASYFKAHYLTEFIKVIKYIMHAVFFSLIINRKYFISFLLKIMKFSNICCFAISITHFNLIKVLFIKIRKIVKFYFTSDTLFVYIN